MSCVPLGESLAEKVFGLVVEMAGGEKDLLGTKLGVEVDTVMLTEVYKGVEDESRDERAEFNKGDSATMAGVISDVHKTVGDTSDDGLHADMSISSVTGSLVGTGKSASGNKGSSGGISSKRSAIESVDSVGGKGDVNLGMTVTV